MFVKGFRAICRTHIAVDLKAISISGRLLVPNRSFARKTRGEIVRKPIVQEVVPYADDLEEELGDKAQGYIEREIPLKTLPSEIPQASKSSKVNSRSRLSAVMLDDDSEENGDIVDEDDEDKAGKSKSDVKNRKLNVGVSWDKKQGSLIDFIDPSQKSLKKASMALERKEQETLSSAALGELQAVGEEICDFMNMSLIEMKRNSLFRGVPAGHSDKFVEFEKATINQDFSHVQAFWSSHVLVDFWTTIDNDPSIPKKDVIALKNRGIAYVQQQLEHNESKFRSFLIKKMDFKRVPRITFKCFYLVKKNKNSDLFSKMLAQGYLDPTLLHPNSSEAK